MLSSDELAELKQRAQEGFYCACPHPTAPCDEYQNTGWCVTKFPVMPSTVLLLVETIEALAAERDELQRRVEALEAIREAAENHIPACAVCTTPDECDLHECSFRDWRAAREAVKEGKP